MFLAVLFLPSSSQDVITSGVSVTTTSSTLNFPSLDQDDEGAYMCSATTSDGGSVTDSIEINVIGKSNFLCLAFG